MSPRDRRELVDHGAVAGKQLERIAQPLIVARRRVPGQRVVARRVVVLHRVRHATDQRHLVHDLRRLRQLLADLDAVGARRDRLVRPANALGRVRLHVEHVDVARPAPLKEEDDRLRARLDARFALRSFDDFEPPRRLSKFGIVSPSKPSPPTLSACRRDMAQRVEPRTSRKRAQFFHGCPIFSTQEWTGNGGVGFEQESLLHWPRFLKALVGFAIEFA